MVTVVGIAAAVEMWNAMRDVLDLASLRSAGWISLGILSGKLLIQLST
jgi:hypothetical protein